MKIGNIGIFAFIGFLINIPGLLGCFLIFGATMTGNGDAFHSYTTVMAWLAASMILGTAIMFIDPEIRQDLVRGLRGR